MTLENVAIMTSRKPAEPVSNDSCRSSVVNKEPAYADNNLRQVALQPNSEEETCELGPPAEIQNRSLGKKATHNKTLSNLLCGQVELELISVLNKSDDVLYLLLDSAVLLFPLLYFFFY